MITSVEVQKTKWYHLGFGKSVTHLIYQRLIKNRDFKIFEVFADHLIMIDQNKTAKKLLTECLQLVLLRH